MKEAVSSSSTKTAAAASLCPVMIENVEPQTSSSGSGSLIQPQTDKLCQLNTAVENLRDQLRAKEERNAQLEALILSLTLKLKAYEILATSIISNTEPKVKFICNFHFLSKANGSFQKADAAEETHWQELYRRTSSIEAHQVAEDVDEAVELEGRPQANRLEKEQSKKRTWRRTGMKNLSADYRDAL